MMSRPSHTPAQAIVAVWQFKGDNGDGDWRPYQGDVPLRLEASAQAYLYGGSSSCSASDRHTVDFNAMVQVIAQDWTRWRQVRRCLVTAPTVPTHSFDHPFQRAGAPRSEIAQAIQRDLDQQKAEQAMLGALRPQGDVMGGLALLCQQLPLLQQIAFHQETPLKERPAAAPQPMAAEGDPCEIMELPAPSDDRAKTEPHEKETFQGAAPPPTLVRDMPANYAPTAAVAPPPTLVRDMPANYAPTAVPSLQAAAPAVHYFADARGTKISYRCGNPRCPGPNNNGNPRHPTWDGSEDGFCSVQCMQAAEQ